MAHERTVNSGSEGPREIDFKVILQFWENGQLQKVESASSDIAYGVAFEYAYDRMAESLGWQKAPRKDPEVTA